MNVKIREFKTDNLGLSAFLQLNGLEYLHSEIGIGKHDKPAVFFVFSDKLGIGKDLELQFVRSNEKRYRDLLFFFRNEIEKLKMNLERFNLKQSRKSDDKYHGSDDEDI